MSEVSWLLIVLLAAFISLLSVGGCAGAQARYDGAPPAIDINHHTTLLEIEVDGVHKRGFGQVGWSYAFGDVPRGTLTINTPLPGSIDLYGRGCAIDETSYHPDKGGAFKYDLSELLKNMHEAGVSYCRVDVTVSWELKKPMTSEYPLHGMSAEVHFDFRKEGHGAVDFKWSPKTNGDTETKGVAYSQFRGVGPVQVVPTQNAPHAIPTSEPLRLLIDWGEDLTGAQYRVFGCGLGVESAPISGSSVYLSTETLLGKEPKMGSCTLFGWVTGINAGGQRVIKDIVVGVSTFRHDGMKLSGNVEVTEDGKICYNAEDVVSVAILNYGDVNESSFDLEHCFKAPGEKSILGLFTVKGRAVYISIDGQKLEYWQ